MPKRLYTEGDLLRDELLVLLVKTFYDIVGSMVQHSGSAKVFEE
jgi:hypothetical protein